MKLFVIFTTFLLSAVYALPAEVELGTRAPRGCGNRSRASPLYRSYNNVAIDHFYTTNQNEQNNAIANSGYSSEGVSSLIFKSKQPGTIPLYRLYNSKATDHFYTTNSGERDSAASNGYKSEGIAGYLYPTSKCGGVPFYRLYSAQGTDHFYTTSASERNSAAQNGYTVEGIAGYVYRS